MESLPESHKLAIASWLPAKDIVRLGMSCRSFQNVLLGAPASVVLQDRNGVAEKAKGVRTFRQLHFYEVMQASGLLEENRLGFSFGQMHIASDAGDFVPGHKDDKVEIKNSQSRLHIMHGVMKQFPDVSVKIDAHCGTLAPYSVVMQYSLARAGLVADALLQCGTVRQDQLTATAWGNKVAHAAAQLPVEKSHPYCALARRGWGWAEVSFTVDKLTLPPRPSFYDGIV